MHGPPQEVRISEVTFVCSLDQLGIEAVRPETLVDLHTGQLAKRSESLAHLGLDVVLVGQISISANNQYAD